MVDDPYEFLRNCFFEFADTNALTAFALADSYFDNVIMTPHIAGRTFQTYEKIVNVLAEKIISELQRKFITPNGSIAVIT